MGNVVDIIKEIFTTAGYDVSQLEKDFDLTARKGKAAVLIKYLEKPEKKAVSDLAKLSRGSRLLLIATSDIDAETKNFATNSGVSVWDRTELEMQIGKAILADVEGGTPEIDIATGESTTLSIISQPVKISRQQAMAAGKRDMGMADEAVLRFVPFYTFDYTFDLSKHLKQQGDDLKGSGSGCVNALNGRIEIAPLTALADSISTTETGYAIDEPAFPKDDITAKVLEEICKHHSKDLKSKAQQGESVIIEHKVIKPQPKDIELKMNMAYVPFWEVKSKKGSFEMNAYNGKVSEAPIDNDAEFV